MKFITGTTINRGKLKRDIKKGLIIGKCGGKYTDDYFDDYLNNYSIGEEYIKVIVFPDYYTWVEDKKEERAILEQEAKELYGDPTHNYRFNEYIHRELVKQYDKEREEAKNGENCIVLEDRDFRGYGSAWATDEETICLSFGSYLCYKLKYKN